MIINAYAEYRICMFSCIMHGRGGGYSVVVDPLPKVLCFLFLRPSVYMCVCELICIQPTCKIPLLLLVSDGAPDNKQHPWCRPTSYREQSCRTEADRCQQEAVTRVAALSVQPNFFLLLACCLSHMCLGSSCLCGYWLIRSKHSTSWAHSPLRLIDTRTQSLLYFLYL